MSEPSTESFKLKIMRMFLPIRSKNYDSPKKAMIDVDIVDPLERFERAILKDSESKSDARNNPM